MHFKHLSNDLQTISSRFSSMLKLQFFTFEFTDLCHDYKATPQTSLELGKYSVASTMNQVIVFAFAQLNIQQNACQCLTVVSYTTCLWKSCPPLYTAANKASFFNGAKLVSQNLKAVQKNKQLFETFRFFCICSNGVPRQTRLSAFEKASM